MNIGKTLQIVSNSSSETEHIGEQIGRLLRGGEVIQLASDVGGGKTTLVRGIAKGAGSNDHVSSPTFTVSQQYECPNFTIIHYDFYRLSDPGLLAYELSDTLQDNKAVCVIEWSEIVKNVIDKPSTIITFSQIGDDKREIFMTVADNTPWLGDVTW